MTSRIRDWAERREAECAELSDMYDSAGSVEEFLLEVDQLLPQCPKALVRVFLLNKWLEKRPHMFIAIRLVFGLVFGLLTALGIFLSTGA